MLPHPNIKVYDQNGDKVGEMTREIGPSIDPEEIDNEEVPAVETPMTEQRLTQMKKMKTKQNGFSLPLNKNLTFTFIPLTNMMISLNLIKVDQ